MAINEAKFNTMADGGHAGGVDLHMIGRQDAAPCDCCATRADWFNTHIDPDDTYIAAVRQGKIQPTLLDYEGLDLDLTPEERVALEEHLADLIAGPWEALDTRRCYADGNDHRTSIVMETGPLNVGLFKQAAVRDDGEAEANARLISAAPELLACLERTHDILSFLVEDGLLAGRTDVIEQLEANLAIFEKAKGERILREDEATADDRRVYVEEDCGIWEEEPELPDGESPVCGCGELTCMGQCGCPEWAIAQD